MNKENKSRINKNIFKDQELKESRTCAFFTQVQKASIMCQNTIEGFKFNYNSVCAFFARTQKEKIYEKNLPHFLQI